MAGPPFDVASASRHWEATHRPVDPDPPRRRARTPQVDDEMLDMARPSREFRARRVAEARLAFRGREWSRMSAGRRRKLARDLTLLVLVEFAGVSGREAESLLGLGHGRGTAVMPGWRARFAEIAGPEEDDRRP
jgi:hypothetical protein